MPVAALFGCGGTRLSAAEIGFFREADPWGLILFARNVENPPQVAALVEEFRTVVGRRAAVLIDQEGGSVARLRPPHWRSWDALAEDVRRADGESTVREALRRRFRQIARELTALGIDVNCAPLLDVPRDLDTGVIGSRALGDRPERVAERGRVVCDTLFGEGVVPVVKHAPGHGSAGADSHHVLPVSRSTREELDSVDMAPFRALSDMPVAMTAHVAYDALDPGIPATWSKTVVRDTIRGAIGFDGLLLTDDLGMDALSGSPSERAGRSIAAGCDIALHCSGDFDEMQDVMRAVPSLDGAALRRAERVDSLRATLREGRSAGAARA